MSEVEKITNKEDKSEVIKMLRIESKRFSVLKDITDFEIKKYILAEQVEEELESGILSGKEAVEKVEHHIGVCNFFIKRLGEEFYKDTGEWL